MNLLGYVEWHNLVDAVAKWKMVRANTGTTAHSHFVKKHEMVPTGFEAERSGDDLMFSLYAC
jgi:hypothetical protein